MSLGIKIHLIKRKIFYMLNGVMYGGCKNLSYIYQTYSKTILFELEIHLAHYNPYIEHKYILFSL